MEALLVLRDWMKKGFFPVPTQILIQVELVFHDSINPFLIPPLHPLAVLIVLLDWTKKAMLLIPTCSQVLTQMELVFQDSNISLIPLLHPRAAFVSPWTG